MHTEAVQRKIDEWPMGPGQQTLVIADDNAAWQASLTADRHDSVGCLVWELAWQALRSGRDVNSLSLDARAQQLAAGLSGVLESVRVVEVDPARHEALLRSSPSARRADAPLYYEVLVRDMSQVTIRRFRGGEPGKPRQQVAFALTNETLARLVVALVG